MFSVSVETHFRASHQLDLEDGSKEPAHNHDWSVTAKISSNKLNNMGVVMNFEKLKAMMNKVVAEFDNSDLETVDYFQQNNPSAENVAKYIYEKLHKRLPKEVKLRKISVVEEPGCSAEFYES
jgi:6-pyruvoyltetrahydropterin/6-carboxytetrahydropterin synthase